MKERLKWYVNRADYLLGKARLKYFDNPAWYCLLGTVFLFFLLPEYISPFILFAAYIIFKRQWTREGRLAKVGTVGKVEMIFMAYMLISVLWSPNKLDTLGCAGLWWAVILMQIMIYNLARTKERIKKVITAFVASAALNGLVGAIQIGSYALWINGKLSQSAVLTTPYYRNLDAFIYDLLPFEISTNMWSSRASGFFSNPNLLATMMVVAFPLAIYLFLNASTKRTSVIYFSAITCIAAGMASTLTRAGSIIMLIEWAILFVIHIKKNGKKLALSAIPTGICTVLALLTRYGKITVLTSANMQYWQNYQMLNGVEALQSSEAHFNIWRNIIDYISNHINTLIVGNGFGMEETGKILFSEYGLNKPHAHNFVLEIWMELGIVGLILLFIVIAITIGKLLEINSNSKLKITLTFAIATSFVGFFVFGLSDYIFNSPKQIIMMMIVIGLVQAMSYVYDKTVIKTPKDLETVAKQDFDNIIHQ